MTFIHVVGGLRLFLEDGVDASLKSYPRWASDSSLVKCPSQDILLIHGAKCLVLNIIFETNTLVSLQGILPRTAVHEVRELFVPANQLEKYMAEATTLPKLSISKVILINISPSLSPAQRPLTSP